MSPVALVLALALHGMAAAGLWWASPLRPTEPPQDAIMITVDAGAPPSSTEQQGDDKPAHPVAAGTPEPAQPEELREEQREEPQQALAEPQPPRPEHPPPPSLEQALASPEELPPPTARDFPKPLPPPKPPRPAARPPQGAPSQAPLPRPTQPAPPANAAATAPAPPSNSSDWLIGKGRARNAYLDQVARLTSRYRFYPRIAADNKQEGRVVTRVTIAREASLSQRGPPWKQRPAAPRKVARPVSRYWSSSGVDMLPARLRSKQTSPFVVGFQKVPSWM